MIYIDQRELKNTGRTKFWRVFADTSSELRDAIKTAGAPEQSIEQAGAVNEHAVMTTTQKNKLSGARDIDDKAKAALFRRKRAEADLSDMVDDAEEIPEAEPEEWDEDEDDFDVPLPDPEDAPPIHPKGKVRILGRTSDEDE